MLRTAPSASLQVGHPPYTYDVCHKCLQGSPDHKTISPKRVRYQATLRPDVKGFENGAKVYQISCSVGEENKKQVSRTPFVVGPRSWLALASTLTFILFSITAVRIAPISMVWKLNSIGTIFF